MRNSQQHDGNDGRGGTVTNMMGMMEDNNNNMRTRGTAGRSLSDLPPHVYIHNRYRASPGLPCHDCMSRALFRALPYLKKGSTVSNKYYIPKQIPHLKTSSTFLNKLYINDFVLQIIKYVIALFNIISVLGSCVGVLWTSGIQVEIFLCQHVHSLPGLLSYSLISFYQFLYEK